MSITAAPGATIEASVANFPTGLTGTVRYRVLDNAGATTSGPTTTGITEYPAGSGVYTVSFAAPATGGQYTILWDTGTLGPATSATEDLVVQGVATAAAAAVGGTFSYAGTVAGVAITSNRDKTRLELGDTDPTAVLFYDEEYDVWLGVRGSSYLLAAADAADAAARKFARAYDFETDGQSFKRSQMAKAYKDLAKELRSRAGGITTVDITKVDGWSDDIANQEVTGSGTVNPRHYHYRVGVADLP